MAKYHINAQGNPGKCSAAEGNCPYGADAPHFGTQEEARAHFEAEQAAGIGSFGATAAPDMYPSPPPRRTAREIGTRGSMMHYTDPELIKGQLQAFKELGILEDAMPVLDHYAPVVAAAWKTGRENALNYEALADKPVSYTYEGRTYGDTTEYFTSESMTWVGSASYELQTAALNNFLDRMETGSMTVDEAHLYTKALGDTKGGGNAFLAFNFNPDRQPHGFLNNVANRVVREGGFKERQISKTKTAVAVPSFLWNAMDKEARERMASQLVSSKYDWRAGRKSLQEFATSPRGVKDFGELVSSAFAYKRELHLGFKEGETVTFDQGERRNDASYPVVAGKFTLTDDGFEWEETQSLFFSASDRAKGLAKKHVDAAYSRQLEERLAASSS